MKKVLTLLLMFAATIAAFNASAQNRIKIQEGLYLVSYGNTCVIEDDVNQRTISMTISQEQRDERTNQNIYKVACGKWTKRVVKDGLNMAIVEGIKAAGVSGGTSLVVSAASKLAMYIYDDVCDYYGEKYK